MRTIDLFQCDGEMGMKKTHLSKKVKFEVSLQFFYSFFSFFVNDKFCSYISHRENMINALGSFRKFSVWSFF